MIEKVTAHIEACKDQNVKRLVDLLKIPSVSTDPQAAGDVRKAAEWIHAFLAGCGFESEIVETPGHPCVIADTGEVDGEAPTLLIYGHYDVQPVGDESLWHSPAFEPAIREEAIYARGAADDKGQVMAHLFAVESWVRAVGKLPLRVKFLIEGEEEIGSANLGGIVEKFRDRLACDYVILSDTGKFDADTPAITCGTRGLIFKEIVLTGPKQDLHSGSFGGTIINPGNALASIIAGLKDSDNRVTIPGFYADVRSLTPDEEVAIAELPFDENGYLESMGAPALDGEAGFTTLHRRWVRPTLDVNGLYGGFTGEGGCTIIPAKMMAKVSMRIVPDQEPEKISELFDAAVRDLAPKGIRVEILTHACAPPYLSPLGTAGMNAAARALKDGFGKAPAFNREGGTLPILALFKKVLGAESLMMGLCQPNCNAHGPNEFFHISDFHNGIRSSAMFMQYLACG